MVEKLRDTVSIITVGRSLGFTIGPDILKKLALKLGETIEIEIFEVRSGKKPIKTSLFMTRKIITIGGGSKGVTIKSNIVKELSLKAKDVLGVNIFLT